MHPQSLLSDTLPYSCPPRAVGNVVPAYLHLILALFSRSQPLPLLQELHASLLFPPMSIGKDIQVFSIKNKRNLSFHPPFPVDRPLSPLPFSMQHLEKEDSGTPAPYHLFAPRLLSHLKLLSLGPQSSSLWPGPRAPWQPSFGATSLQPWRRCLLPGLWFSNSLD